jgi:alcohol dehydrogenase class IV
MTDALAQSALRMLGQCIGPAMHDREAGAMADQLVAASMAVIAFENAGVGLAHVLGRPIEGVFHLPHGRSVGILLPRVGALAAHDKPDRIAALGAMLGGPAPRWADSAQAAVAQIEALYDRLGFPASFDRAAVDPDRLGEMARRAYVIQELGTPDIESVHDASVIRAANGASITVGEAESLYRRCMAR